MGGGASLVLPSRTPTRGFRVFGFSGFRRPKQSQLPQRDKTWAPFAQPGAQGRSPSPMQPWLRLRRPEKGELCWSPRRSGFQVREALSQQFTRGTLGRFSGNPGFDPIFLLKGAGPKRPERQVPC